VIDLGQTYRATLAVVDASGNPANPASAVLTIELPDGTVDTPAVPLPPSTTGLLVVDYKPAMAGLFQESWVTTQPDGAGADVFNVRQYVAMVGLGEMKLHLNAKSSVNDDELRNFIQAATEMVEDKVGKCVRRSFTSRVDGGEAWSLVLPNRPVLSVESVTSVWPSGPSWTTAQLNPDLEAGIVRPAAPLFPFWWGPWDVAYTAGRKVMREPWLQACKEQVRHLWETQRGGQAPVLIQGEEVYTTTSGWSFSVPRRVLELLEQDMVPSS